MDTKIIDKPINLQELKNIASKQFGDMVKAVVDLDEKIMAVGGELHADQESILLENGSKQGSLWGINLWVDKQGEDFVEFDSMINIRPSQNNRSRMVEDTNIRAQILNLVDKLVTK